MTKNLNAKQKRNARRVNQRRILQNERKAEQRRFSSQTTPIIKSSTASSRSRAPLEALMESWVMFERSNAEAYYAFHSQMISMPLTQKANVDWVLSNPNYSGIKSVHGTILHEATHWLDHCSTLWGRENLIRLYNALNAWAGQNVEQFHIISQAFRAMHEIRLPDYYTTLVGKATPEDIENGLISRITCGFGFGPNGILRKDQPIVFCNFHTKEGAFICRTPLSITALSECCAVAAQVTLMAATQGVFADALHLEIEHRRKFSLQINTPDLAVYSIAMQCFAAYAGVKDVLTAYSMSSSLARLCLNLPPEAYSALKVPVHFTEHWKIACEHFKTNGNPGFAFLVLSHLAGTTGRIAEEDWLEATLKYAGLPPLDTLTKSIDALIAHPHTTIIDGPFRRRLEDLLAVGARNFNRRGGIAGPPLTVNQVFAPDAIEILPIRLKDAWLSLRTPQEASLKDPERWLESLEQVLPKVLEFVDACARAPG